MPPDSAAIRAELEKLLASPMLANSRRLSRFLRYVVDAALAGESNRLKEYVIGVEVFDRDERYDPRVDSIVRVEASRLRAKLDEYYRHRGACDTVVISIERGGYAPVFDSRGPEPAQRDRQPVPRTRFAASIALAAMVTGVVVAVAAAWRTQAPAPGSAAAAIAVLPFTPYATTGADRELALRLSDGVTGELVRLGTARVVASASVRTLIVDGQHPRDIAAALSADWLVQGRVSLDGHTVHVDTVLLDGGAETKLWFESFSGADLDELERRIAADVHRALETARAR